MPRFDIIEKMETAMRFIYGHFLLPGEPLDAFMQSREGIRPKARHIVRFIMYNQFHCTYEQIAKAEHKFDGIKEHRHHSTIEHSVDTVSDWIEQKDHKGYREIMKLFNQGMDYWEEFQKPPLKRELEELNNLPKHVLVVILAMGLQFGGFDRQHFEALLMEFKTVSEEFFNQQLSAISRQLSEEEVIG